MTPEEFEQFTKRWREMDAQIAHMRAIREHAQVEHDRKMAEYARKMERLQEVDAWAHQERRKLGWYFRSVVACAFAGGTLVLSGDQPAGYIGTVLLFVAMVLAHVSGYQNNKVSMRVKAVLDEM